MTTAERAVRRPPVVLTEAALERFLETLRAGLSATSGAAAAGAHRSTLYRRRADDAEFAEAWDETREEGIDRIVDEAVRRAITGVERPVFGKGGAIVGNVVDYSDRLLELFLRGLRPETFGTSARVTITPGWENTDFSGGPTLQEVADYLREIGAHDHYPAAPSDRPALPPSPAYDGRPT